MNQATFIGNLTANAVQRATRDGSETYATFSVAVNNRRRDTEETLYVNCVKTGNTAAIVPYLTKGTKVAVTGRVTCSAWIDKQGMPHASLDLFVRDFEFVGGKPGANSTSQPMQPAQAPAPAQTAASQEAFSKAETTAPQQPKNLFGSPQPTERDLPF